MNRGLQTSTTRVFLAGALLAAAAYARSSGAPAGVAGVPGEGNCTQCHSGTVNSGTGRVQVAVLNGSGWRPGQQLQLRVTVSDPDARRWGFELAARKSTDSTVQAGSFSITDAANTQLRAGTVEYVTHTSAGSRAGTSGSSTWDVNWNPPADNSFGPVIFYVAGNAANNDGTNGGDKIYTSSLTVNPEGSGGPTTTYALPQFVYGGGWYTALYFSNTDPSPKTVTVKFYDKNGQPLSVPGQGATPTLNLAGNGTMMIEAPNQGGLTEGWASADLPSDVIGYGVFRQTVSGIPDQEAVVPLTRIDSQTSFLAWDETAFTTAVAISNPTDTAATVGVTVRDPIGSTIGTTSIPVAAKSRVAVVLRNQAGLSGMLGNRGQAVFNTPTGAISVLGLRFGGSAFTSIPAEQK